MTEFYALKGHDASEKDVHEQTAAPLSMPRSRLFLTGKPPKGLFQDLWSSNPLSATKLLFPLARARLTGQIDHLLVKKTGLHG